MIGRITGNVTHLLPGQVFVFGSNEAGNHGRGAAAQAKRWGARRGVGYGHAGATFAIPTKPGDVRLRLSLGAIRRYVDTFVTYARSRPDLTFLVTEIGCGLAGYAPTEVAPLFAACVQLANVHLPRSFWDVLTPEPPR